VYWAPSCVSCGRALSGQTTSIGNRFAGTCLSAVPVPLPVNYLLGVDTQKSDFERGERSYLRGQWRDRGWWYYYPYAMAVKGTLGGMLLILLAAVWAALNPAGRASSRDELLLVVRALAHICTKYTRHVIGQSGLLFAEDVFTCTHRAQLLASILETGASGAAAPASVQAACI